MTSLLADLGLGFSIALTFDNLLLCLLGCLIGTLIGVLPGIGPIATISILLPFTFGIPPVGSMIMLAGIYYGAQYGGSTTAILVRMPGEAGSIVTIIDGNAMARAGRAGAALALAALSSFVAGCVATIVIGTFAEPLGQVALYLAPEDYFALIVLGLVFAIVLAGGSLLKAILAVLFGIVLATVGTDMETGAQRLTFGLPSLLEGLNISILAMGIFGIGEILHNVQKADDRPIVQSTIGRLWPSRDEIRRSAGPAARGTVIGSLLGVLPGSGTLLAPFASYVMEKKLARDPSRFGRGAPEGVAGPEAANNAASQTCFIPLLSLGLPPNAVMALMLGALTIQGIVPGPQVFTKNPDLFWGMVASMWIGNAMLLVINLPLIGIWVSLLKVPYRLLFPAIILFCCIGLYSVNRLPEDIYFMAAFGVVGLVLSKLGFEAAPLLLGFVLGDPLESNFRRTLILGDGDWWKFVSSPIAVALLLGALVMVLVMLFPKVRKGREDILVEE
ncbi:tripartite tricarboxylate transporter permease [Chelatococcus asaccharovorans]|uniref:Putative tricarboxylic transport membrane protein n=1 Tax=Chelatococcus asaccharovorans TaxID=28210 RepID=A0A2V3UDQ0_9HYPH|nr:tripartite tricarboxylate transporter permease [Chelatococcus asaccharovorans]MBS7707234.1 tripartite tricarboxylate transporter permease [Chelatococcus asaccharovorans]PXW63416.1 putative tricarboxylic transport membrane protein [Chelatococcus asaccharovorans]